MMKIEDEDLDIMLGQPLNSVADDGFSDKILTALKQRKRRAQIMLAITFLMAALCLAFVLPAMLMSISLTTISSGIVFVGLMTMLVPAVSIVIVLDS